MVVIRICGLFQCTSAWYFLSSDRLSWFLLGYVRWVGFVDVSVCWVVRGWVTLSCVGLF